MNQSSSNWDCSSLEDELFEREFLRRKGGVEGETHVFINELEKLIVLFGTEALAVRSILFDLFELTKFGQEKRFAHVATVMPVDKFSSSRIFQIGLLNQFVIILGDEENRIAENEKRKRVYDWFSDH